MAYDALDGLTLLVGGLNSDSWAFGTGKVAFVSIPGPGGWTRMGGSLHANGTAAWFPFKSYAIGAVPESLAIPVTGTERLREPRLVQWHATSLRERNRPIRILGFPDRDPRVTSRRRATSNFNATQYANGSSPYYAAPGTFSLSAPPCGTAQFDAWSVRGNATIANATNSTTQITLTGSATVVAHFLVNLEFYAEPHGGGSVSPSMGPGFP